MALASDWLRIGLGLAPNWHPIGSGLATDWRLYGPHSLGPSASIGSGLASAYSRIGMENTGLALALPIQIGASIGFGLAQDWLIGPNWHALATPQRGMPIHVNPVQSANPRPIQNTAETVRPPDWHGLADWIFKKGEYFTLMIVQSGLAWIGKDWLIGCPLAFLLKIGQ